MSAFSTVSTRPTALPTSVALAEVQLTQREKEYASVRSFPVSSSTPGLSSERSSPDALLAEMRVEGLKEAEEVSCTRVVDVAHLPSRPGSSHELWRHSPWQVHDGTRALVVPLIAGKEPPLPLGERVDRDHSDDHWQVGISTPLKSVVSQPSINDAARRSLLSSVSSPRCGGAVREVIPRSHLASPHPLSSPRTPKKGGSSLPSPSLPANIPSPGPPSPPVREEEAMVHSDSLRRHRIRENASRGRLTSRLSPISPSKESSAPADECEAISQSIARQLFSTGGEDLTTAEEKPLKKHHEHEKVSEASPEPVLTSPLEEVLRCGVVRVAQVLQQLRHAWKEEEECSGVGKALPLPSRSLDSAFAWREWLGPLGEHPKKINWAPLLVQLEEAERSLVSRMVSYVQQQSIEALKAMNKGQYSPAWEILHRLEAYSQEGAGVGVVLGAAHSTHRQQHHYGLPAEAEAPLLGKREIFIRFFADPSSNAERSRAQAVVENNRGLYHCKLQEYRLARDHLLNAIRLERALQVPTIGTTYFNLAQAERALPSGRADSLHHIVCAEDAVERTVYSFKCLLHSVRRPSRTSSAPLPFKDFTFVDSFRPSTAGPLPLKTPSSMLPHESNDEVGEEELDSVKVWLQWREAVCLLSHIHQQHGDWRVEAGEWGRALKSYDAAAKWLETIEHRTAEEEKRLEEISRATRSCRTSLRCLTRHPTLSRVPTRGAGKPSRHSSGRVSTTTLVTTLLPRHVELSDTSLRSPRVAEVGTAGIGPRTASVGARGRSLLSRPASSMGAKKRPGKSEALYGLQRAAAMGANRTGSVGTQRGASGGRHTSLPNRTTSAGAKSKKESEPEKRLDVEAERFNEPPTHPRASSSSSSVIGEWNSAAKAKSAAGDRAEPPPALESTLKESMRLKQNQPTKSSSSSLPFQKTTDKTKEKRPSAEICPASDSPTKARLPHERRAPISFLHSISLLHAMLHSLASTKEVQRRLACKDSVPSEPTVVKVEAQAEETTKEEEKQPTQSSSSSRSNGPIHVSIEQTSLIELSISRPTSARRHADASTTPRSLSPVCQPLGGAAERKTTRRTFLFSLPDHSPHSVANEVSSAEGAVKSANNVYVHETNEPQSKGALRWLFLRAAGSAGLGEAELRCALPSVLLPDEGSEVVPIEAVETFATTSHDDLSSESE